jgi:hypothetical protein
VWCTRQADLEIFSQLRATGIPLDEEVVREMSAASRGLSLYQVGVGKILELYDGRIGYCLYVGLRNDSDRILSPHAHRLETLTEGQNFAWLKASARREPKGEVYVWPGHGTHGIPAGEVLNHRLGSKGKLFPGDCLEGFLLGVGDSTIPENYRNGQRISRKWTVFDGRGIRYHKIIKLTINQDATVRRYATLKQYQTTEGHRRLGDLIREARERAALEMQEVA